MNIQASTYENEGSTAFRDAFWRTCTHLPCSVAVVAAVDTEHKPFGFTVSSLTAVSVHPPLVSICVERESKRISQLHQIGRFSINVLERSQADLAQRFATPGTDRFAGIPWRAGTLGIPVLSETVGVFFCKLRNPMEAGDRHLILGEVVDLELNGGEPLVYWRRAFHRLHVEYPFLESETSLEDFVERWKQGTLPKHAWTHGAHVAIAAYFAFDHSPQEALETVRTGIMHFNTCVGTPNTEDGGYHETLTRFWSGVVREFVRTGQFVSRWQAVRRAVQVFGEDRDRHRLYYSFDVVRNRAARQAWMAPDRTPSPEWLGESAAGPRSNNV